MWDLTGEEIRSGGLTFGESRLFASSCQEMEEIGASRVSWRVNKKLRVGEEGKFPPRRERRGFRRCSARLKKKQRQNFNRR